MQTGLYEQLINKLITSKLDSLDRETYYIKATAIDKQEASKILANYLINVIQYGLSLINGDIEKQIEVSNKIIRLLRDEVNEDDFDDDIIDTQANI
jgi:MinD superfamily P-loop ATPase